MNAQECAQDAFNVKKYCLGACRLRPQRVASTMLCGLEPTDHSARNAAVDIFAQALEHADVLLWTHEMFTLSKRGADAFVGARVDRIFTDGRCQFWFFADWTMLTSFPNNRSSPDYEAIGCLVIPPNANEFRPNPGKVFEILVPAASTELDVPTIRVSDLGTELTTDSAVFAASRAFIDQKLAVEEPIRLPRAERRRLGKAQSVTIPEFHVIQLREREASSWHDVTGREYHHRWLRSGCWRRLNEPLKRDSKISGGRKGDQVVWVRPAICGPDGAPLLDSRESVYAVAR